MIISLLYFALSVIFNNMILFMGFSAGWKRGGEVYNYNLFKFIKSNFEDVQPNKLVEIASELRNPFKHLLYNLANVREKLPEMIIMLLLN